MVVVDIVIVFIVIVNIVSVVVVDIVIVLVAVVVTGARARTTDCPLSSVVLFSPTSGTLI